MEKKLSYYFLVPGLSEKYRSGGLMVIRQVAELISKSSGAATHFITTHENNPQNLFSNDIASIPDANSSTLFFVTWGPLVEKHINQIRAAHPNAKIIYYAQSFGWAIKVPPNIKLVCASRYIMSQWALARPELDISHIPPPLQPFFKAENNARDTDILIHTRKQNDYCLKKLLPELEKLPLRIKKITDWLPQEKFARYLSETKLFLYLTSPHKHGFFKAFAEGFGLPALEAVASGAIVGSNLQGGVTDFLTPNENCIKLGISVQADIARIRNAVKDFQMNKEEIERTISQYKADFIGARWAKFLMNNS